MNCVLAGQIRRCLFNHLGRLQEEARRDRETKLIGGLQVDDQLELRGPLNRQVRGLRALENLVYISESG